MRLAALLMLASAQAGAAAPIRVASLNLCTDELALLLAAPGQLVSVSRLAADREETALAGRARGLVLNNGRMESVAALAPDLVLTSGGVGGTLAGDVARRLGARVVDLPFPTDVAAVRANIRTVADALGRDAAGAALIAAFDTALGPEAAVLRSALLVGGAGVTPGEASLAAQFLRHAGLRQRAPGSSIGLAQLLAEPPAVLVISRYRQGQMSLNAGWMRHPALPALPSRVRRIGTDGRAWTCMGPLAAIEVARLRAGLSGRAADRAK